MEQKAKKVRKSLLIAFCVVFGSGIIGTVAVLGINLWVTSRVSDRILTEQQAAQLQDVDCIVVLGCQVKDDGTPSHMLEDRLKRGVALYQMKAAPKLLMSGDHGTAGYDEVNTMKKYAIDAGVPSVDVFMDHAGFSTYETMNRAINIFQADKVIVVTQQYHLYRAMYVAEALGIEAYGVAADYRQYSGQFVRDVREVLARVKDFGLAILKPDAVPGEAIPISGDGSLTHDKNSNFE